MCRGREKAREEERAMQTHEPERRMTV
jgi:hypothetical protein